MEYSIASYFLYFIIISVCGWFMEITLQLVQKHKFADRGFLIGPYCPIYGMGALLITIVLTDLKEHPFALFCVAIVICAVLEYSTSYVMEKLFHARWWDYSNEKYNINGRICLETIIPFGLLGLLLIYIVNPFIFNGLANVPQTMLNIVAITLAVFFAIDFAISFKVILNVSSTTKKFDEENPKDNTEELSEKVREFLRGTSFLNKRLVDAFPKLTTIIRENKEKIIRKTEEVREDITEKANDLSKKAEKVKSNVKKGIDKTSRTVKVNLKIAKRKATRNIKRKEKN